MASTVNGAPGAANNGAIVSAILLLNNVPSGEQTRDVVSSGTFSLKGLPAGTYQLKIVLNNNQLGNPRGSDVTNSLVLNTITVDGSSTYAI